MQHETYELTVNNTFKSELTEANIHELDVVKTDGNLFHLLKNGKAYRAELISFDLASKTVSLKVNGNHYHVSVADHYDLLINKMGLSKNIIHKIAEIRAPMPGLVLNIQVEPGQEVVHGEPLLILEAMKMENIIKSPGEGKVKTIKVTKGKPVEKGELLIEME